MAQMKLLIIVANLVLVRLALATYEEALGQPTDQRAINKPSKLDLQQVAAMSSAALEQVNSLDSGTDLRNQSELNQSQNDEISGRKIGEKVNLQPVENSEFTSDHQEKFYKSHRDARKLDSKNQNRGQGKRKRQQNSVNFSHLLLNLLGQLEKVDVKKIISDSLLQSRSPSLPVATPTTKETSTESTTLPIYRDSSLYIKQQQLNNSTTITDKKLNNTIEPDRLNGKAREGVNASALGGDTGNLLSITKQLVKLARNQMVGGEYGSTYPGSSSWFSPLVMPSMLSAASHMLHDSNADFTAASLKSDWFWVVVPAVIVIGAGVIVVPLVAAWLVSHMMSQNTFTVSAGRRRRRRRDVSGFSNQSFDQYPNQAYSNIHEDLFKMLDIHRLLDDAPQLLVEKLSRFYTALDSVGSTLTNSAFNKTTKVDNALDSKLSIFKRTFENN